MNQTYLDVNICEGLSLEQKDCLRHLVSEFQDLFTDLPGTTSLVEHKIDMVIEHQTKQKPYKTSIHLLPVIKNELDNALALGIIKKCIPGSPHSLYGCPIVMVRKYDQSWWMCINFKSVDKFTIPIIIIIIY